MSLDNIGDQSIAKRIAIKLWSDGMDYKTYNLNDAVVILERTCAPARLVFFLKKNESMVRNELLFLTVPKL